MMNKINFFTICWFLSLFISYKSYSSPLSHAEIEKLAETFLRQQLTVPEKGKLSINLKKIDNRLEIKQCTLPLVATLSTKANRRNVRIKVVCDTNDPWKIYLSAKVSLTIPVVIAQQALDKNTLLTKHNIVVAYIDSHKIRGTHIDDAQSLYGSKTKKKVTKGHNLSRKNICMVCKDEQVSIVAQSDSFVIKTVGSALSNGNLGDTVRIKNKKSGKIISAQVTAINKVVINL
jgi:flagella basal body P-ring formation protein FlgA